MFSIWIWLIGHYPYHGEPVLMTLNVSTKEKVIYYCYTSSSSFTVHFCQHESKKKSLEITFGHSEDEINTVSKAMTTIAEQWEGTGLRPLTVAEQSHISTRLLVSWAAVVICCHISSLDVRMWCLRGRSRTVSPPVGLKLELCSTKQK